MEQDNLRKFYHEVGQNLEKVKLLDLVGIIGFAGLSALAYVMTNYWAYKGHYSSSLGSGLGTIYAGFRLKSTYKKAVKNIGKI
ncbi:hypothetical protein A3F29_03095 [Candidatus Roizmanbacteria bacterium RIFCSPHIGHO2_12_FULL_33_9]|uniref:Uncharacterized protein n=1 Tax=Candidatus Roizmanbacteria bacterium RIFCSPHIGHO2_12_FULL_33_9 TaxID=1802045 RepID=A0A1F7HG70_9BACT|nr:MAG: hypothetical protein A3F29_03095 [Candidatus Roizmanbacteria bacterium RIFCSPHIGHO2_12_FULL_33_9]